ncbi:hypothetical protein BC829DRAFT_431049 [Chytridium lagenaria]|nr:hypothetical protein BC829DRAFT_431049 [Chytridium lagenaria]
MIRMIPIKPSIRKPPSSIRRRHSAPRIRPRLVWRRRKRLELEGVEVEVERAVEEAGKGVEGRRRRGGWAWAFGAGCRMWAVGVDDDTWVQEEEGVGRERNAEDQSFEEIVVDDVAAADAGGAEGMGVDVNVDVGVVVDVVDVVDVQARDGQDDDQSDRKRDDDPRDGVMVEVGVCKENSRLKFALCHHYEWDLEADVTDDDVGQNSFDPAETVACEGVGRDPDRTVAREITFGLLFDK